MSIETVKLKSDNPLRIITLFDTFNFHGMIEKSL